MNYVCRFCNQYYFHEVNWRQCEAYCRHKQRIAAAALTTYHRVQDGLVTCFHCKKTDQTYEHVKRCRAGLTAEDKAQIAAEIRREIEELSDDVVIREQTVVLKLAWVGDRDVFDVVSSLQGESVEIYAIDLDQSVEFVDLDV